MLRLPTSIRISILILLVLSSLASLFAIYRRFHVESSNRRVELAVEWQEVMQLAQSANRNVDEVLARFKEQRLTTLIIAEDTFTSLELQGMLHPTHRTLSENRHVTAVFVDNPILFTRIQANLDMRGLLMPALKRREKFADATRTIFVLQQDGGYVGGTIVGTKALATPADYSWLRTTGLGLPLEATETATRLGLRIAARVNNFPGVTQTSARATLEQLTKQNAKIVIFSGEEVLGFRGLEKTVAEMFRTPEAKQQETTIAPTLLTYGAVELGKQKGDEKITDALKGDYIRVHSIQAAEMGQNDQETIVERFVRAVKERNIRFCYIRLFSYAQAVNKDDGISDPVAVNTQFLQKIARGISEGNLLTAGGYDFGAARKMPDPGVPPFVFALVALGTAGGAVWLLRVLAPMPMRVLLYFLVVFIFTAVLIAYINETGRKLVALTAGIVFPTLACLTVFPKTVGRRKSEDPNVLFLHDKVTLFSSLLFGVRGILLASAITMLGVLQVTALLASRPFMLRADQFFAIKAQHIIPVGIVGVALLLGVLANSGEGWRRYRARIGTTFSQFSAEPLRVGSTLLGIVAIGILVLVALRTGNEPGVGVSTIELRFRAFLDHVLPVRPRTKEFLFGHPALLLGLALCYRGRRRLGTIIVTAGALGQVSLLNTFCHIHSPLILSVWRAGIGLFFGMIIGAVFFIILERLLPPLSEKTEERA